jgi:hypothetical protein
MNENPDASNLIRDSLAEVSLMTTDAKRKLIIGWGSAV